MVTSQVAVGDYEELDFRSEWNDKCKWLCATKGHDLTYILRGSLWYLDNRLWKTRVEAGRLAHRLWCYSKQDKMGAWTLVGAVKVVGRRQIWDIQGEESQQDLLQGVQVESKVSGLSRWKMLLTEKEDCVQNSSGEDYWDISFGH